MAQKRKMSKVVVNKNLERLNATRSLLASKKVVNYNEIPQAIGGSAALYMIMVKKHIIYKTADGYWTWYDRVPVTETLAKTLTKEVTKYHARLRSKGKTKPKVVKSESEKKELKPMLKEPKAKTPKAPVKTKPKSTRSCFELVILWGLIQININCKA